MPTFLGRDEISNLKKKGVDLAFIDGGQATPMKNGVACTAGVGSAEIKRMIESLKTIATRIEEALARDRGASNATAAPLGEILTLLEEAVALQQEAREKRAWKFVHKRDGYTGRIIETEVTEEDQD